MFQSFVLSILSILTLSVCFGQNSSLLFQNEKVQITFKPIDLKFGLVLEEYPTMYGGTVVRYTIDKRNITLEEIDTVVILDSMLFSGYRNYYDDSIEIVLQYRVQEFQNTTVTDYNVNYLINDSLIVEANSGDQFHRVLIPKTKIPYNLKAYTGDLLMGEFTVNTLEDVYLKFIILAPVYLDEVELDKLMPDKIKYGGKNLNLLYKPLSD